MIRAQLPTCPLILDIKFPCKAKVHREASSGSDRALSLVWGRGGDTFQS